MLVVTVFGSREKEYCTLIGITLDLRKKNISYEMRYDMIREIIMLNFSPRFPYGIKLSTPTWERRLVKIKKIKQNYFVRKAKSRHHLWQNGNT